MSQSYRAEMKEKRKKAAESPTKAYNLLWISPNFPTSGEEFRQPYLISILKICTVLRKEIIL